MLLSPTSASRPWLLTACLMVVMFAAAAGSKPNVLVIIADDLGWGDVGCYGNTTLRTPNIDRLAKGGARLNHALAAASMCTPSRAALMTGRYPIRGGMASSGGTRVIPFLGNSGGLLPSEVTFPRLAQQQGYATALIGKWHLGLHCFYPSDFCHHPLKHGFDYFYGLPWTNCRDIGGSKKPTIDVIRPNLRTSLLSIAMASAVAIWWLWSKQCHKMVFGLFVLGVLAPLYLWFIGSNLQILNGVLMRNFQVIEQPVRLEGIHKRFLNESKTFIAQQAARGQPFLVVLAFTHVHTAHKPTPEFKGRSSHGIYGDMVEEMDFAIGQQLDHLTELGLSEDTFIIFTSDQGAHLEEVAADGSRHGGFNGPFRGGKGMGGMEGALRVPTIVRWPKRITPGQNIDWPVSNMDFYPTIASVLQAPIPPSISLDGHDILPLLTNPKRPQPPPRLLVHYCGTHIHAARWVVNETHIWKAFFATPNWFPNTTVCQFICPCKGMGVTWHDPPILYNIAQDWSETQPIPHKDPIFQEVVSSIKHELQIHENSVQKVQNQLEFPNIIWYPWLQPCCNFPTCHCSEGDHIP